MLPIKSLQITKDSYKKEHTPVPTEDLICPYPIVYDVPCFLFIRELLIQVVLLRRTAVEKHDRVVHTIIFLIFLYEQ